MLASIGLGLGLGYRIRISWHGVIRSSVSLPVTLGIAVGGGLAPISALDYVGLCVWGVGFFMESTADYVRMCPMESYGLHEHVPTDPH